VDLPGRDHAGDPAVYVAGQEIDGLLSRGVVAQHDVTVRVDEPGRQCRALGIDHGGCGVDLGGQLLAAADRGDETVGTHHGVRAGDDRCVDVAGEHGAR